MSHPQQKKFETTTTHDFESSFSSYSSFSKFLLSNNTSPTTLIRLNKTCFKHNPYRRTKLQFHHRQQRFHYYKKSNDNSGCFNVSPRPWNRVKKWLGSFSLMASQADISVHVPGEYSKKKIIMGQQQKKEELEREVSVLHKMLAHEEKVHEYLERLQHRQNGSVLSIPNFLPPKMKEVLAELAMVENEITRLESQISQLQSEVKHEKEVNLESKSKEWRRGTILMKDHHNEPASSSSVLKLPPNIPPNISTKRSSNEKVASAAFETKALHFISKAIKGDYNLSDFSINDKTLVNFKGFSSHEEAGATVFREKLSKRSGLMSIKPPSPLREPRHPTPRRDRNLETPIDVPSKILSTPLHSEEERVQTLPPNKLSENIMKCLVFIFVRLLRTSRAMEFEKSGPIARSTNFSMSFRADTTSSNSMFQKDTRQQDPYDIFVSEESIPRDIGPYKNLVRFTSSSMDLKCIQNSSSIPLFQKLKILMDGLQKVDLRFLSHQQKLAFWINMYNACIMHGFLQYGVPSASSPESMLTLINKATLNIAGNTINAQAIEHLILRKHQGGSLVNEIIGKDNKENKGTIVSELYGLETPDPNITFALCCGTRSSPAVKIYTAEGVTAELERSKLDYLQAAIVVTSTKRIALPELLLRNMNDYAKDKESLLEWLCQQLPTSGTLRKSIVECFRGLHGGKASTIVEKIPYEFEFQYLLPI